MAVEEAAPAKLNLTLHVTGRRADGYHLLDSLVAFADIGDRLRAEPAARSTLAVTGPMAADVPAGPENLVLRAAALMEAPAALTLDKRLPAAAGLGGGSADAAAALRALHRLQGALCPTAPPSPRSAPMYRSVSRGAPAGCAASAISSIP